MSAESVFKGYELGNTHKTLTGAMTYGLMFYMGFAMAVTLSAMSLIQEPNNEGRSVMGLVIMLVVLLALAVSLHVMHTKSPERQFTVLRNYSNGNGTFASEVRYLDGTTSVHEHGNGDGFWKQLGGFTTAMVTGK